MVQTPVAAPVSGASAPADRTLARKREILDAASRVFRERGLHSAGMRDIADELGMHVGNLYYYFRNREELLAFCQADALSGLLARAEAAASSGAPADRRLRELMVGHVEQLNAATPGSLAHLEVEALTGAWRERILAQRERYETAVRTLIREGVEEGVLAPSLDPKVAAMGILGALNWTVKWFRPEGGKSAPEIGGELADLLLGGLRRSPPPREADTTEERA